MKTYKYSSLREEKPLGITPASWFPNTEKTFRLSDRLAMEEGMGPESSLFETAKTVRLTRDVISSGIVPAKLLEWATKISNDSISEITSRPPEMLLLKMYRALRMRQAGQANYIP